MTIKLTRLDAKAYTKADEFFRSDAARDISAGYFDYVYSSFLDYLTEGDHLILTRVLGAARIMHRVQLTTKLLKVVACHEPAKKGDKFIGKLNKAKRARLINDTAALKAKLEAIINADAETKAAAKAAPFDADSALARLAGTVERMIANGVTPDAILSRIGEVASTAAEPKTTSAKPAGKRPAALAA